MLYSPRRYACCLALLSLCANFPAFAQSTKDYIEGTWCLTSRTIRSESYPEYRMFLFRRNGTYRAQVDNNPLNQTSGKYLIEGRTVLMKPEYSGKLFLEKYTSNSIVLGWSGSKLHFRRGDCGYRFTPFQRDPDAEAPKPRPKIEYETPPSENTKRLKRLLDSLSTAEQ